MGSGVLKSEGVLRQSWITPARAPSSPPPQVRAGLSPPPWCEQRAWVPGGWAELRTAWSVNSGLQTSFGPSSPGFAQNARPPVQGLLARTPSPTCQVGSSACRGGAWTLCGQQPLGTHFYFCGALRLPAATHPGASHSIPPPPCCRVTLTPSWARAGGQPAGAPGGLWPLDGAVSRKDRRLCAQDQSLLLPKPPLK